MSDSLRLYSTLLRAVGKAHPHEDPRRLKVFAWLVTGLLLEKSVSLPWLATVLVSAAKAASRVRRRRRFLANPRVPVRADSDGLIRAALAGWAGRTISLAIDTTSWAGRLVVCRVAVIYRGRAVPLVWQVDERTSVMLAFADDQALLEHARPLVPPGATIILLGDRGFRTTKLMDWCDQDPNWHFRLRLKGDQLVRLPDYQHAQAVSTVRLKRGMVRFLHGVWLGGESYGPIEMAMAWADTPEAEPWYIASDETAARQTLTEYGLRMDVEIV